MLSRSCFSKQVRDLVLSCLFILPGTVVASDLEVIQNLSFGKLVVLNASTSTSITVHANGQITKDDNFYILEPGYPAILSMRNFPPNTLFNYTISTPAKIGQFDFEVMPSSGSDYFLSYGGLDITLAGKLTAPAGQSFHNNNYAVNFYFSVDY